jgi:hypothetical protein
MNTYWFDIEVAGPVTEEHSEALADRLATRGGIDATVQADHRGGTVMFSGEADDAIQAIVSAIDDVEAARMTATGVTEDASQSKTSPNASVTVTAVRYWISGGRGPGGFPQPKVARARGSLYSWAEVSARLSKAKLGQVDHLAAETARAASLVHDAPAIRRGIRELARQQAGPLVDGPVPVGAGTGLDHRVSSQAATSSMARRWCGVGGESSPALTASSGRISRVMACQPDAAGSQALSRRRLDTPDSAIAAAASSA